jgi:hypothetical protein
MKTTKKLIFKLRLNYDSIQNMIEWQKPLYQIEKRIEKCLLDIEMAMRLTRMTEAEAKELFEIEDNLRELYNEI